MPMANQRIELPPRRPCRVVQPGDDWQPAFVEIVKRRVRRVPILLGNRSDAFRRRDGGQGCDRGAAKVVLRFVELAQEVGHQRLRTQVGRRAEDGHDVTLANGIGLAQRFDNLSDLTFAVLPLVDLARVK